MSPAVGTAVLLLVGILNVVTANHCNDPAIHDEDKPCGEGWSRIDPERCAKFYDSPKTFRDAEELCRTFGSDLLSLHSVVQIRNVVRMILRSKSEMPSMWLGAKRSASEVAFSNLDGSDFDFEEPWLFKPVTFNREVDCIESNSGVWGFWIPQDCTEVNRFVCSKKM